MHQRKKNIRLLTVLIVLILLTIAATMVSYTEKNGEERDSFTIAEIDQIDRIAIQTNDETVELSLVAGQWKVNNKHSADLARINDLFVIFEKINIRGKVPENEIEGLLTLRDKSQIVATVFNGEDLLKTYALFENEKGTITYLEGDAGEFYICNIPGHTYHIAQLFGMRSNEWRSNYVFASNWTTLEEMQISYPERDGFAIKYSPKGYFVEDAISLDSAKMFDYLERVSFLQAKEFLTESPQNLLDKQLQIDVRDAGTKSIHMEFFNTNEGGYVGYIDSVEWASFRSNDIISLIKSKDYFSINKDK